MVIRDLEFLLLAKTPEGNVHQVVVDESKLRQYLKEFSINGKISLIETPIEGITFEKQHYGEGREKTAESTKQGGNS